LFHLVHYVRERDSIFGISKDVAAPAPGCPKNVADGPNILSAASRESFMNPAENAVGI